MKGPGAETPGPINVRQGIHPDSTIATRSELAVTDQSYSNQRCFRVKNLEKYQHYKTGRHSLWAKLYVHILHDPGFTSLPDREKATMILLILLAVVTGNRMPFDRVWVRKQLSLDRIPKLNLLIDIGFIEEIDSILLDTEEKRREEKRRTIVQPSLDDSNFDLLPTPTQPTIADRWEQTFHQWFWLDYPRKEAKQRALKAYMNLMPKTQDQAAAMAKGICDLLEFRMKQWEGRERNHIPLPASWLNSESFSPADVEESMLEEKR